MGRRTPIDQIFRALLRVRIRRAMRTGEWAPVCELMMEWRAMREAASRHTE